jgi:lecithin-cholesterol acyltransferase
MFVFSLPVFHFCLHPIVIIPPLYGTNLFINFSNANLHWYCPDTATNELFWVSPKYIVPPNHNCLLQLLTVYWNNETHDYSSRKNTTIFTDHFGHPDTVKYVDSGIFGHHFIESFATIVKNFQSRGWEIDRTLFAAPYDWRLAPTGLGRFWKDLQSLIEHAYSINNETKITIFGYSCGGFATQQFLSKYVTDEWKQKFIDRVILLAPSFGGVGDSFFALWNKRLPVLSFVQSADLSAMIESMPVIMSHLPNIHIFGERELVRGPFDTGYSAKELPGLLLDHEKLTGDNRFIFEKASAIVSEFPHGPELPTYIVYNSAIQTDFVWHFRKGWEKQPASRPVGGDGTIIGETLDWACRNWSIRSGPLKCIDLYRDHDAFAHTPLSSNPYIVELIGNLSENGEWAREKGRSIEQAPYVVINGDKYIVRKDIRDRKVLLESKE